jgi:hypothetical protein
MDLRADLAPPFDRSIAPSSSQNLIPRSKATQAITFECVK